MPLTTTHAFWPVRAAQTHASHTHPTPQPETAAGETHGGASRVRAAPADPRTGPGGSARTPMMLHPAFATPASQASAWPDAYALRELPDGYRSTARNGVYADMCSGQMFILHEDKAYAVAPDRDRGTWRLAVPGDPSQLGQQVMLNARGEWARREDIALPGTGPLLGDSAARGDPKERERAATYMLTHRRTDDRAVANTLQLPIDMIRKVAADVDAVRHAWRAAAASGATGQGCADAPLTPREKAFVDRWAATLNATSFAAMMQYPQQKIDAYLQSGEHGRTRAASSLQQAVGLGEAVPRGEAPSQIIPDRGARLPREQKSRVIRMLSSNPAMAYREIAAACAVSFQSVTGLARKYGLQRDRHSVIANARSELFDDFILFPATSVRNLAQQHRLPMKDIKALRKEFAPIRAEWNAIHRDDIADNRPELYAWLPDGARQFIRQWSGTLSATHLGIVMKMPASAIDAYMQSAEYRRFEPSVPAPASASSCAPEPAPESAPASTQRPASPQPGPSASQQPSLAEAQKVLVLVWTPQGMRPDSLAAYLSMLAHAEVPQAAIEAFIASPEYERRVRGYQSP